MSDELILEVYQTGAQWGGRLIRDGQEDGRVSECASKDDVIYAALEVGINPTRIIEKDHCPGVDEELESYQ